MTSLKGKMLPLFRKLTFITVISGATLSLVACWDRVETNDLAIITGVGIDYTEDGQIDLSFQIFIPSSAGTGTESEGANSSGGQETLVMSHKGKNISDALSKIQANLARKLFWGVSKIVIFGENAAKEGIQDHMDFLLRHPEPRERAYVFVGQGEAKKYLELNAELERYSAEYIREMADRGYGMGVTLLDLDNMLTSEELGVVLPYLKEYERSSMKYTAMAGTAVFKKDRMSGLISESTTRGLLWLRNELKDYTINVNVDEQGEVALYPATTTIDLIPNIEGEEWKMLIKVEAEGAMVQNTSHLNINVPASLDKVKHAFQEKIERRIRSAIHEAMAMQTDVVYFGKKFHQKYPKEWEKIKHRWEEKFPEVKVEFAIETNIRRKGNIATPVKEN